jgi:uncharacterized protein HemX
MTAARRAPKLLAILLLLLVASWRLSVHAGAADQVVLAQDTNSDANPGPEEESQGQESSNTEGSSAETGADKGQTEPAADETGPPWTYQMARLGILLIVAMVLGVGLAYYRFVVRRQRGAT